MSETTIWAPETRAAVESVEANANEGWKAAAYRCVLQVAERQAEFTADDVMELLEKLPVSTHTLRAFGGVMVQAMKNGIAEQTPRAKPSKRKNQHNCPIRVWRSRIYKPGAMA